MQNLWVHGCQYKWHEISLHFSTKLSMARDSTFPYLKLHKCCRNLLLIWITTIPSHSFVFFLYGSPKVVIIEHNILFFCSNIHFHMFTTKCVCSENIHDILIFFSHFFTLKKKFYLTVNNESKSMVFTIMIGGILKCDCTYCSYGSYHAPNTTLHGTVFNDTNKCAHMFPYCMCFSFCLSPKLMLSNKLTWLT